MLILAWTFGNAALLWGLVLSTVPLIIHLINRKRTILHRFAAMEFLLKSVKKVRKRIDLKNIILLLLRTMALVFLVLGLSDPNIQLEQVSEIQTSGKKSVIIAIDQSASMRWQTPENRSLYDLAKARALEVLKGLGTEDEVALILFDQQVTYSDTRFFLGKNKTEKMIESSEPGFLGTQMQPVVEKATSLMERAVHAKREVHIFHDMRKHAWELVVPQKPDGVHQINPIDFLVHDVSQGYSLGNVSIQNISTQKDPSDWNRIEIQAELLNSSSQDLSEVPISLQVEEGEVARSFQSLTANQLNIVNFSLQNQPDKKEEMKIGKVEVLRDALQVDNQGWFLFHLQKSLRVLVIDGSPSPDPRLSESYYVTRALEPLISEFSSIQLSVLTIDQFTRQGINAFDMVYLANVGRLGSREMEAIRSYIGAGGHVLLSMGNQMDISTTNAQWSDIMPFRLRDLRVEKPGVHLRPLEKGQEIFPALATHELDLFEQATFSKFVHLEGIQSDRIKVLMSFATGAPALVVWNYKKGNVGLWATTLDQDWNNFPIQTTYVPFIQSLTQYIASDFEKGKVEQCELGKSLAFQHGRQTQKVKITLPNQETFFQVVPTSGEQFSVLDIQRQKLPGPYQIEELNPRDEVLRKTVAFCKIQRSESDFTPMDVEIARDLLPGSGSKIIEGSREVKLAKSKRQNSYQLKGLFLLLALFVLGLESIWMIR